MKRRAVFLALALLATLPAHAQISPEEQARRLLEDGRAAWAQGKVKQALDSFNTIVTGFPTTTSVDDALLEIGRYYAEVEKDTAKAREAFEAVSKRFPQSDGAPGAYWYLGMLTLQSASEPSELDDALAQFTRVQRLYPRSDWVPKALYAAALVHRRAGRLPEATGLARRVGLEYPASDAAPAAQMEVGYDLVLIGDPQGAMEEFQHVRNRYPQSAEAPAALDRITALWRLYGPGTPGFRPDPSFAVGAGDVLKDVRAVLADREGNVWIASDKIHAVVPFNPAGAMGASYSSQDISSLSLTAEGDLVVAARLGLRIGRDVRSFTIPGDKPTEPEPLDRITAGVILPGRSGILVADDKRKRIYRYDAAWKYVGAFPDAKEREVSRMVLDPEGFVVVLDDKLRAIQVFDKRGALVRTVGPTGPGYSFRKPADVAVDAFRNLYVADAEAGVFVLSPAGQLLAVLKADDMRKPVAVTVDPRGAVLVYDEKLQRVVRFR